MPQHEGGALDLLTQERCKETGLSAVHDSTSKGLKQAHDIRGKERHLPSLHNLQLSSSYRRPAG